MGDAGLWVDEWVARCPLLHVGALRRLLVGAASMQLLGQEGQVRHGRWRLGADGRVARHPLLHMVTFMNDQRAAGGCCVDAVARTREAGEA